METEVNEPKVGPYHQYYVMALAFLEGTDFFAEETAGIRELIQFYSNLKSQQASEDTIVTTVATEASKANPEETLKIMKIAHDYHATLVHLVKTRGRFKPSDFDHADILVAFYSRMTAQLLEKIHEIEPPKKKENKPYIVEAPPLPTIESSGDAIA